MIDRVLIVPVTRAEILAAAAAVGWPSIRTPNGEQLEGEVSWRRAHLGYASERRTLFAQLRAMRKDTNGA